MLAFTFPGAPSPTLITPTQIQAAQLMATIPANLLTTAGTAQVAIQNGLGVLSNSVSFSLGSFTISSVNPTGATAGASATPVTVNGLNLNNATSLLFTPPGGAPQSLSLQAIQAAQVAATIPASLLTSAGTAQIALSNGAGVFTNQLQFAISTAVPVQPVAAFLDQGGEPVLTFNNSTSFPDAGGFLLAAPGVAQAPNGDAYIFGLDSAGGVHMNSYSFANSIWNGWQYANGILDNGSMPGHVATGLTAAVAPNGIVWFTGRDIGNRYWLNSWTGSAFGGWILIDQGILDASSVPQIAITANGVVYVVGKDVGGRVWSNSYNPATQTFSGWIDRQGIIVGQPSVTAGQDGNVYVAVRSITGGSPVYIQQIPAGNGVSAPNWINSGGLINTDPLITSSGTSVYITALAQGGFVYLNTFSESSQTFGGWNFVNGTLSDETIAVQGGNVFIAGRDMADRIYWYNVTGNSWFFAGGAGVSSTTLAGGK